MASRHEQGRGTGRKAKGREAERWGDSGRREAGRRPATSSPSFDPSQACVSGWAATCLAGLNACGCQNHCLFPWNCNKIIIKHNFSLWIPQCQMAIIWSGDHQNLAISLGVVDMFFEASLISLRISYACLTHIALHNSLLDNPRGPNRAANHPQTDRSRM